MAASALSFSRFYFMLRITKRWWIPLFVFTVLAVNLGGFLLPRRYEAQSVVVVQEPKMTTVSNVSNDMLTVGDRLKSIREEITSQDFLREVAASTNLDAGIPPETPRHQKLIQKMADAIELRVKEQALFSIAYQAGSPQVARDVTRAIVDLFQKRSEFFYNEQTKRLETLVSTELKEAQAELQAASEAVVKYENEHFNEIPDAQERHLKRLSDLTNQKQNDARDLKALQEKLDLAHKRLEKMDPNLPTAATTGDPQNPLSKAIEEKKALEIKLNLLLKDYTDSHPDVIQARAQLGELNRVITEAMSQRGKEKEAIPNREYAELQNQIAVMEIEQQRLQASLADNDRLIQELDKYLNNIPKYKGPLDLLENDRKLKSERVDRLTKQLDEARITGALEQKGLGPSFTVQSYPQLPLIPISPNPKKIAVLSGGMGFMASMGLVYLFTLMDNVLRTVDEARGVLQMPVLGIVQRIITPQQERFLRRRRRRRLIGAGTALALLTTAVLIGFFWFGEQIAHSFETLTNIVNQW